MTVTNQTNTVVFDDGKVQYAFPRGTVILTSSKNSKSVNVKLKGSRKTILTFLASELGKDTAQDAINSIIGLVY